eukprot:5405099-Heterocapsa_arctica.AAC.1
MGNLFCLNLSAPYLCRYFYDRILALLPFVDYMFGSEAEYLALAEHSKELALYYTLLYYNILYYTCKFS